MNKLHKFLVLFALFIVPLIFYIFLQLGTHNFGKLAVISKDVADVSLIDSQYKFQGKISVVIFLGDDLKVSNAEVFNLNEKIYKKFYGYTDFQLIAFVSEGKQAEIEKLKKKLSINTNLVKWNFIFTSEQEMQAIHESFKTSEDVLDSNFHISKAYLIDKEKGLRRGKSTIKAQEDENLFGYNMKSVAELKNDMHDDIKVVLAEYSFALKKNNTDERRKQSISNEKK